jgi:hypothetical protein
MVVKKKNPKTRDYFLVALIRGATKAAVHVDRKKKSNKYTCRKKVKETE